MPQVLILNGSKKQLSDSFIAKIFFWQKGWGDWDSLWDAIFWSIFSAETLREIKGSLFQLSFFSGTHASYKYSGNIFSGEN